MLYRTPKIVDTKECAKIAQDLKDILDSGDDLILDFSQTERISSMGIREILIALKGFRAKQKDFSVVNPNELVKEIFHVVGIDDILLLTDKDKEQLKR